MCLKIPSCDILMKFFAIDSRWQLEEGDIWHMFNAEHARDKQTNRFYHATRHL
jgi:hypothetical protein